MLSNDDENGAVKIDEDILTELKSKHPPAAEVKRHLGEVIGSNDFRTKHVNKKVTEWCNDFIRICKIATTSRLCSILFR